MAGGDARRGPADRALAAARASAKVAFLDAVSPDEPDELRRLARELAALANSGGGAVVVGAASAGAASGWAPAKLLSLGDSALAERLGALVDGDALAAVTTVAGERSGAPVVAVTVPPASVAPVL